MKKKLMVLCMIFAVVLSCASVSISARTYNGSITAEYGSPNIDGVIDDVWAITEIQDVCQYPELLGFPLVETDTTGTVQVLWDKNYFYVLVVVDKKDTPVYPGEHDWSSLSNTDNVLIPFSQVVTENKEDVQSGNANAGAFRVTAGGKTNGFGDLYTKFVDIYEVAAKIVGNTYICEFAIPWNDMVPEVGTQALMEVQINVNTVGDDNRYTVVEWAETETCEAWANTAYMSLVTLIDEPEADETAAETAADGAEQNESLAPATVDPIAGFAAAMVSAGGYILIKRRRSR